VRQAARDGTQDLGRLARFEGQANTDGLSGVEAFEDATILFVLVGRGQRWAGRTDSFPRHPYVVQCREQRVAALAESLLGSVDIGRSCRKIEAKHDAIRWNRHSCPSDDSYDRFRHGRCRHGEERPRGRGRCFFHSEAGTKSPRPKWAELVGVWVGEGSWFSRGEPSGVVPGIGA